MSPETVAAREEAMALMRESEGSIVIDLAHESDGLGAMCGLIVLLEMAKDGICSHERISSHAARFALIPNCSN